MFSLNQLFSLLLALVVTGISFAQINYESPHVKDGKTIQFTLPNAYFEVEDVALGQSIVQLYTTNENISFEEIKQNIDTFPILTVMHLPTNKNSLESMLAMVEGKFAENEITEIETPGIYEINGRDVMLAAAKGEIDGKKAAGIYVSVIAFGDYCIMISYSAADGVKDVMKYKNFKKIISSWKEIETENENQLTPPEKEENDFRRNGPSYYQEESPEGGESIRYREVAPPPPPPVEKKSEEETIDD